MILADKIIKERKKLGLSQEELAEKMNVSRQAVSKWESNQSVPEIDKILQLSELFGVTTDYLLKDNIEANENPAGNKFTGGLNEGINEGVEEKTSGIVLEKGGKTLIIPSDSSTEHNAQEIRKVTMKDAENYLSLRKAASYKIAIGTFLCILSVIPLFLLAAVSEAQIIGLSEAAAASIGLVILLFIVAIAVVLFVYTGSKNSPYEFLEKEPFETEKGVTEMVREQQRAFNSTYTKLNIFGSAFCVLSPIPLFIGCFSEKDYISVIALSITMVVAGIGALLFILAGVRHESMQRLLKEGDYSEAAKKTNSIKGIVGTIYWLVVIAVYLVLFFIFAPGDLDNNWKNGYSWLIWPVAGVLFPVVMLICEAVQRKKNIN